MLRFSSLVSCALAIFFVTALGPEARGQSSGKGKAVVESGPSEKVVLPKPFATPYVRNRARVIGWPAGLTPKAPPGFQMSLYGEELDSPRKAYVLPNKDVLVVETRREFRRAPLALREPDHSVSGRRSGRQAGTP